VQTVASFDWPQRKASRRPRLGRFAFGQAGPCTSTVVTVSELVLTPSGIAPKAAEQSSNDSVSQPAGMVRGPAFTNEEALVAAAKEGDRDALGVLLRHYGPMVYASVLLPRLGNEAGAKDALSEVYRKVLGAIASLEYRAHGIYPWLRTIALRVALDQLRARKRNVVWSPEDIADELDARPPSSRRSAEAQWIAAEDRARVKHKVERAMARIPERYQEVIRRRVLAEEPRLEVAKTMDIKPETLDVLLHRALAALKKALESAATEAP
jgi:RNA polymerase sigma factor (sigma-70 family)